MQRVISLADRASQVESSLLVLGETGAGKEWLARRIHARSLRAREAFVAVNCAALPESLWESEMFGHERGAFTGAEKGRRGRFELAHRGTLFLDEIGEIPLHLQAKLLRVLETRQVQRLGSEEAVTVDLRLMAATNRRLDEVVESGGFRADLYFRLAVMTLDLPPLRERREDIPELAAAFFDSLRQELRPQVTRLRPEVLEAFAAYEWPGNVRELANAIETGMLLTEGEEIGLAALPLRVRAALGRKGETRAPAAAVGASKQPTDDQEDVALPADWRQRTLEEVRRDAAERVERDYLRALLREAGGRIGETARRAGIAPRSLYNLMRRHGLRKEDYKGGEVMELERRRRKKRQG